MATKAKAVKKFNALTLTPLMETSLSDIATATSGALEYTAKAKFAVQCIQLAKDSGYPMHIDESVSEYGTKGEGWSVFGRTRGSVTDNFSVWCVDKINVATGENVKNIGALNVSKSLRPVFFPIVMESVCKNEGSTTKRVFDSCKRPSADDDTKYVDQKVQGTLVYTNQDYFKATHASTTGEKTQWRYTVHTDKIIKDIDDGTLVITRDHMVLNAPATAPEKAHADKFNPKNFKKAECEQAVKDCADAIKVAKEKLELLQKYKKQLIAKRG